MVDCAVRTCDLCVCFDLAVFCMEKGNTEIISSFFTFCVFDSRFFRNLYRHSSLLTRFVSYLYFSYSCQKPLHSACLPNHLSHSPLSSTHVLLQRLLCFVITQY